MMKSTFAHMSLVLQVITSIMVVIAPHPISCLLWIIQTIYLLLANTTCHTLLLPASGKHSWEITNVTGLSLGEEEWGKRYDQDHSLEKATV